MTYFFDGFDITGSHFYHYGSCKTRLWLFHNNVEVGKDNDHMAIGRHIDSTTFLRNRKSLVIQGLCQIDYIEERGEIQVHEIKKGHEVSNAIELQVQFYMYIISRLTGKVPKGYVHFPEVNRIKQVEFKIDDLLDAYKSIKEIISGSCPKPVRIPICHGCAYSEMCWS